MSRYDRSIVEGPLRSAVWKIAWPTMLTNMVGGLQGIVDHVLVGHLVGYTGNAAIGSPEDAPLDELRAVVGNPIAMKAYRLGQLPFPDGAMLVKLAWKRQRSTEFPAATVPGAPTTVQVMVKDSKRYADSGGWGYGRFIDGKPVDAAQHQTCFACHNALVKARKLRDEDADDA